MPFTGEFPDKECNRCGRWGSRGFRPNMGVWECENADACQKRAARREKAHSSVRAAREKRDAV